MVVPITWMRKVSSFLGLSIQNPPLPATSHLLVLSGWVKQCPETAALFSAYGFQRLTNWQPAVLRWRSSIDQSCDLGFPCGKSSSAFGVKVHLSQNGCHPFKYHEPIDI